MAKARCGTCAFWVHEPGMGVDEEFGACRRRPPVVLVFRDAGMSYAETQWPSVGERGWCGEYAPDERA